MAVLVILDQLVLLALAIVVVLVTLVAKGTQVVSALDIGDRAAIQVVSE